MSTTANSTEKETFTLIDNQEDFVVINKSHGVNFHDESSLGEGLFNQVKQVLLSDNNEQSTELYPIHRLDKMTSGLLIFAKNLSAAQQFQQLFSQHHIEKYYVAISDKKPKKKQGLIKGDMEKSRRGSWKLVRRFNNPAISQFFSYPLTDGKRLYLIKPHSGKSHQIRVALSSIGAPILGDERYYGVAAKACDRGYLHAYALKFEFSGKSYQYQLPPTDGTFFLDDACKAQLASIDLPWLVNWPVI